MSEPTEEREEPVDPAIFERPEVQAKIARALKATAPTEPTEEELADAMDDQADALDRVKPGHLVATDDAVVLLRAAAAEIRRLAEALRSSRAEIERRDEALEYFNARLDELEPENEALRQENERLREWTRNIARDIREQRYDVALAAADSLPALLHRR